MRGLCDMRIIKSGAKRKSRRPILWFNMIFNMNEKRSTQWNIDKMRRRENIFLGFQKALQPVTYSKKMQFKQDVLLSLL